MQDQKNQIEILAENAEMYAKTSIDLLKLQAVEKTALVGSAAVSRGVVILMISMFIIIVNIAVGLWLGDILGKLYYGFFCVAGFYGLFAFVIYFFFHNRIKERVSNSIISQLLNWFPCIK
ncbi:MAG: hypothetical protein K0Q95_2807 [Bacteroidota bacterium]|jgi:hypothetical protein|nr:hypothetical protein [Bacteroidota bacterium]